MSFVRLLVTVQFFCSKRDPWMLTDCGDSVLLVVRHHPRASSSEHCKNTPTAKYS